MNISVVCRNKQSQRLIDGFPVSGRNTVETAREDCLHFNRDDDNSSAGESPSSSRRSPMRSMYGFFLDKKVDRREVSTISNKLQPISKDNKAPHIPEITGFSLGGQQLSEENLNEIIKTNDLASVHNSSTGAF